MLYWIDHVCMLQTGGGNWDALSTVYNLVYTTRAGSAGDDMVSYHCAYGDVSKRRYSPEGGGDESLEQMINVRSMKGYRGVVLANPVGPIP